MYDITEPKKPVKLTKIPSGLMCLSLYLNSNLISVDLESDSLTEFSVTCCYHVKSIRLIANVHTFSITDDMPLDTLVIDSKVSLPALHKQCTYSDVLLYLGIARPPDTCSTPPLRRIEDAQVSTLLFAALRR
jgi:hypothetical protein